MSTVGIARRQRGQRIDIDRALNISQGRIRRPRTVRDDYAYRLSGIGTKSVSISRGVRVVIHGSATVDVATSVTAATGLLYREYVYATRAWSWAIAEESSVTETPTKRIFRRAYVTCDDDGYITGIFPLQFGIMEVLDKNC